MFLLNTPRAGASLLAAGSVAAAFDMTESDSVELPPIAAAGGKLGEDAAAAAIA